MDAIGGGGFGYGAPEILTGGRDGKLFKIFEIWFKFNFKWLI